MSAVVYCTLQVAATHQWSACPYEEVAYLRDSHRHVFHIKAYKEVTHSDRDVEFIMLKNKIQAYFDTKYWNEETKQYAFGEMSCEMIGQELIDEFELFQCDVSEDNENGSVVFAEVDA